MNVERKPRIFFTRQAYFEMMEYCRQAEGEVTGFGTVVEDGDTLLVEEVFIVPQSATSAGVQVDGKALLDFMTWANEVGRPELVHTSKLWWHSHAKFDVFRSKTDNDTIDMLLGLQPYVLAVVGNRRSEYECSLHYKAPRVSFTNLRIEKQDYNPDTIRAYVAQEIKDKVKMWKRPDPPAAKWPVTVPAPSKPLEVKDEDDFFNSEFYTSEGRKTDTPRYPNGRGSLLSLNDEEFRQWMEENGRTLR